MRRTNLSSLVSAGSWSALIVLVASNTANAQPHAQRLSPPLSSLTVYHYFPHKPMPKWENGFVLAFEMDSPEVFAWNREGQLATRATIRIADSLVVRVWAIAAMESGVLAVAGSAATADRGATFIAWLDASGVINRVVRTTPFAARNLSFAKDGTLWAFGRVVDRNSRTEPPHDVLRQYDSEGRLLRSLLPRQSFVDRQHPSSLSFMTSSGGRVGIYSLIANEWIEVSLLGEILGRWKGVNLASGSKLGGAAILPSGDVYASELQNTGTGPPGRTAFFRLDKETGAWRIVAADDLLLEDGRGAIMILGVDQEKLVVVKSFPDFLWVRPQ